MKMRILMACAVAATLVSATGATAGDDGKHVKKADGKAEGHAAAVGKPGDPAKVTRAVEVVTDPLVRRGRLLPVFRIDLI